MKKTLIITLAAALLLAPTLSSAARYHMIDIAGNVKTIEAPSAEAALAIADMRTDVYKSGVKIDTGLLDTGDNYGTMFYYVDIFGNLKSVVAASAGAAYILATDISPHSGLWNVGAAR